MAETFQVAFGPTEPDRVYQIEMTPEFGGWWRDWGSPDLHKIYRRHGINAFRRSTALLGLDRFCREHPFKGSRIVEIGTCKGLTAIVLARHFGEVVSIDVTADGDKRSFAEECGITNIRFIDAKDNNEKAEIVKALDFDAAYSDGNHADDAESDFRLVKRCGRVLFHEYWPIQPPVWNLVNRLRPSGTITTFGDCFALWSENRG